MDLRVQRLNEVDFHGGGISGVFAVLHVLPDPFMSIPSV